MKLLSEMRSLSIILTVGMGTDHWNVLYVQLVMSFAKEYFLALSKKFQENGLAKNIFMEVGSFC